MWIDSHAHLYDYPDDQLSQVLYRAEQARVGCVLNAATTIATAETVVRQTALHQKLYGCVGISPFDVVALSEHWYEELEKLASGVKIVAVGECGLDDSNPSYPTLKQQLPVFEAQLALAKKRSLPAIIHSRGAERTVLDACIDAGLREVVFHCFTGELSVLKRILDAGYVVSFSGIATFKKEPLTEQIRYCPLDRLLVETDSPYLAPVPFRGKTNEPCYVPLVGEKIAELKGCSPQTAASTILKTCKALFPNLPI